MVVYLVAYAIASFHLQIYFVVFTCVALGGLKQNLGRCNHTEWCNKHFLILLFFCHKNIFIGIDVKGTNEFANSKTML